MYNPYDTEMHYNAYYYISLSDYLAPMRNTRGWIDEVEFETPGRVISLSSKENAAACRHIFADAHDKYTSYLKRIENIECLTEKGLSDFSKLWFDGCV